MSKESYIRGFCKAAEAKGVDPKALAKIAAVRFTPETIKSLFKKIKPSYYKDLTQNVGRDLREKARVLKGKGKREAAEVLEEKAKLVHPDADRLDIVPDPVARENMYDLYNLSRIKNDMQEAHHMWPISPAVQDIAESLNGIGPRRGTLRHFFGSDAVREGTLRREAVEEMLKRYGY